MPSTKPLLKWPGGKSKLLSELHVRMPPRWGNYFEPFIGGGALFFSLSHGHQVTLGDANDALIAMYQAVRDDVEMVIFYLAEFKAKHATVSHYYDVRKAWNDGAYRDYPAIQAAAFIYLNKTCFNGLWRVNKVGEYNVPKGNYKNPSIYSAEQLRDAAQALDGATLQASDYRQTTVTADFEDFVYCDPPYDPHSKTSNFTAYTKNAFGKDQQLELAEHARTLRNKSVYVMLSNNDTLFIRELYADFYVHSIQAGRAINSKGDKRGKVAEVIITSYEV